MQWEDKVSDIMFAKVQQQPNATILYKSYTQSIRFNNLSIHLFSKLLKHTWRKLWQTTATSAQTQTEITLPKLCTKMPFMCIMFKLLSQDTTIITLYTNTDNTTVSLNTSGCDIRAHTQCLRIVIGTPCWSLALALMRESWLISFEVVRKRA